ncbi:unnamed protein product [Brassica oleracea]
MDKGDCNRTLCEIVGLLKSWLPWRSEPAAVTCVQRFLDA